MFNLLSHGEPVHELHEMHLGSGYIARAYASYTTFTSDKRDGFVRFALYRNGSRVIERTWKPVKDYIPFTDDSQKRPVVQLRKVGKILCCDVTMQLGMGVYEYEFVQPNVVTLGIHPKLHRQGSFEITDYASYIRTGIDHFVALNYDFRLGTECHSCPHFYKVSLIRSQQGRCRPIQTRLTTKKYLSSGDPLSEAGVKGKAWGESVDSKWTRAVVSWIRRGSKHRA